MNNQLINTYHGTEGLLAITEHSLEAKSEVLIMETSYASLNDLFPANKAEEIRQKFLDRKIIVRELTNRMYHEKYTDVKGFHEQVMKIRYIDPKKLLIKVETLIYNDIVAIYEPKKDGFCIEIQSNELADQQRQLFEFIWKQGDLPIIGKGGRSSLF
jgi:hypothetical protein